MLSVEAFRANRQPSTKLPHVPCPACGDYLNRYCEYAERKGSRDLHGGRYVTSALDSERDPHLVVTCGNCGFWWEQEVMSP